MASAGEGDFLPLSDPNNQGQWIYNGEVSDEFDEPAVDEDKWYIVGKFEDGKPFYRHPDNPNKRVWKGRAPSQFSGRNYRLEDGKLILETRWEPDFPFEKTIHQPHHGPALPYENLTTACFIGRRAFQYGYIEIKSKAADAEISSAFWSLGNGLEIDFFELFGAYDEPHKKQNERQLWWSIRDWERPVLGKPVYTEKKDLGFRVADDFHVYGFEWNEHGVKYFVDGELFSEVSADQVRAWALKNRPEVDEGYDGWEVAMAPVYLWIDQEAFPWASLPESQEDLEKNEPPHKQGDGKVEFEVEYVRVWQTREQMKGNR
ncbi:family 16 glycosylhydrolase [Algisphaera agarilytica]|uniref:family 16 glycosylhydrolase n=1 Tax=Algisphaera agarilytica TaxID=1385975 RepID=UPI001C87BF8A|nr:family 16 glycosylhydrolase [Algisphaera agarilytica]